MSFYTFILCELSKCLLQLAGETVWSVSPASGTTTNKAIARAQIAIEHAMAAGGTERTSRDTDPPICPGQTHLITCVLMWNFSSGGTRRCNLDALKWIRIRLEGPI